MSLFGSNKGKKKDMKDPPVPPEKFIHSDVIRILAGPDSKQFKIHGDLLAELSDEMRRLVYRDMGEGDEKLEEYVEMKEVSEETLAYFSEFCYTGEYNIRQKADATGHATRGVDRDEALAHVRLYVFAKRYNIEVVQKLAVGNLGKFMEACVDLPSVVPCLVEYALENISEGPITDKLVVFLARITAFMIRPNSANRAPVHSLLASISRKDFFATFCDSVTYYGAGTQVGGFGGRSVFGGSAHPSLSGYW